MDRSARRVLRNPRTHRATRGHRYFVADYTAAAGTFSSFDVTWACGPYTSSFMARGPRNPHRVS